MWRIAAFVPAASLLLLLAWMTLARRELPSRKDITYLTVFLSLLAWLSIVIPMQIQSGAIDSYRFVAHRDIGYFVGSAVFLCALFSLASILSLAARKLNLGKIAAGGSALVIASACSLFMPGLFATGWVIGCVFAGYTSCM